MMSPLENDEKKNEHENDKKNEPTKTEKETLSAFPWNSKPKDLKP